jgi:hypothetical protein
MLQEKNIVPSSSGGLVPAKSALVASYRTIFAVFEKYREEYGGYDSMPDSCAGLLNGMGLFVDYDEMANKFLEFLGAKRLEMKVNAKQGSQEFFGHILMHNAQKFIQPDHYEAFKCTMTVMSKVSKDSFDATLFGRLTAVNTVLAFDTTDRERTAENKMVGKRVAVPAKNCYFVDSSAEMVDLTNPRYICPDDLPNEVQEGYKMLGSKYLSDAISFHPLEMDAYKNVKMQDTDQTKRFTALVADRAKLLQFALQEKVKFGREINAREKETFHSVADAVLRSIQFKEVPELEQETWFEGRYLSTGPATAVYLSETSVMLIRADGVTVSDVAFQLANAIVGTHHRKINEKESSAEVSLGVVRDMATTLHFVLTNDLKTLQSMHYFTNTTAAAAAAGAGEADGGSAAAAAAGHAGNRARGAVATQSSTALGADASRAVDGRSSGGTFVTGEAGTCSHTAAGGKDLGDGDDGQWWQVDLGDQMYVRHIIIMGRANENLKMSNNLRVSVVNASVDEPHAEAVCGGTDKLWDAAGKRLQVKCGAIGRYIRVVQTVRIQALVLCEVESSTGTVEEGAKEIAENAVKEAEEKAKRDAEDAVRSAREAELRAKRAQEELKQREQEERIAKEEEEKARVLRLEARKKREEMARVQREAEEKAEREAEDKAKIAAEERLQRLDIERMKREAEEKAALEAEEKAKQEAEERAKKREEERVKREAEERMKRETEEKERKAKAEKVRQEEAVNAKKEAEAKAKREAEEKARKEVEEKAKKEAEQRLKKLEEERKKREAEEKAALEAEEKAKQEAEQRARKLEEERL